MEYTVVTTAFNDAQILPDFISNLCNQTAPPKEIIVADGGSKDTTVELLKDLDKNSNIKITVLHGKRLNIAEGFNAAIRAADTEYVFVAGVGNKFASNCLELLIKATEEQKGDMIYPPIRCNGTSGFEKKYADTFLNGEHGKNDRVSLNHGVLLRKNIFEHIGYFYEKFIYAGEDSEFYALAQRKGYIPYCVQEAKLYWDVPKNLKEFKKQIQVYQIGTMQICSRDLMFRINRKAFAVVTFWILLTVGVVLSKNLFFALCCFLLFIAGLLRNKTLKYQGKSYSLDLFYRYFGLLCFFKNWKYMDEKYSVKREQ